MQLAIVLGLTSGIVWGCGDFLGGLASRRMNAMAVAAVSQLVGGILIWSVIAGSHLVGAPSIPPLSDLLLAAAAGVCGGLGVFAFYRALAVGTMSLIAPVSAFGVLVPVVVGLIGGERPERLAMVGAALALAGAVLASRSPGPASTAGLGLALLAAVGFGGFFALIAPAADTSALWATGAAKLGSVPLLLVLCASAGVALGMRREIALLVVGAGALDVAANVLFAVATADGLLSIVSVLGGLYPVATVALAQIFLRERLSVGQAVGVAIALAGVGLIASG